MPYLQSIEGIPHRVDQLTTSVQSVELFDPVYVRATPRAFSRKEAQKESQLWIHRLEAPIGARRIIRRPDSFFVPFCGKILMDGGLSSESDWAPS